MKAMRNSILAGLFLLVAGAGVSQASVIYSNDFNGTEFKAPGVGLTQFSNTAINGAGRLVSTALHASATGFNVRIPGLNTDPDVTAVKLSISGTAPLTDDGAGYLALGFQNVNNNPNLTSTAVPGVYISGAGMFLGAGGRGFGNNALTGASQGANFTSGGEFTMDLIYYKNSTLSAWYNGVQVYDKVAVTHDATPTLQCAVIQFRNLDTAGANIDTFTVEAIPEPATLGLIGLSAAVILVCRRVLMR